MPELSPHDRLLAVLEDLDITAPGSIPCRRPGRDRWISERPTDTSAAAQACGRCPARAACGGYAIAENEPAGIWGGLSVAERSRARRSQAQKASAQPRKEAS